LQPPSATLTFQEAPTLAPTS